MRFRTGALMVVAFVVVAFVVAAFTWGGAAQADRGILSGTIKDAAGVVVPGVTVQARGPMTASAVTDWRGAFRIVNLAPGNYVVTATLVGFAATTARATISVRNETRLALEIHPMHGVATTVEALPDSVGVPSAAPTVDFERSTQEAIAGVASLRALAPSIASDGPLPRRRGFDTESYNHIDDNGFKHVSTDPLSTFSVDVDTASYANVRRFLRRRPASGSRRGAHRRVDQLLPAPLRGARRTRALLDHHRALRVPVEPGAPSGPHRHPGARSVAAASRRRAISSSSSTSRAR